MKSQSTTGKQRLAPGARSTITLLAFCAAVQVMADPVLEWNALSLDCIRADNSSPTLSARNLAILHTAIYDAVNSIGCTHQPYRFQLNAPAGASQEAAATGAAREIIRALYPSFAVEANDLFGKWVASAAHDSALTNGLSIGQAVAVLVLKSRRADGATTEAPYIPSSAPGQWQRTPPFFRPPLVPHWRYVKPFCLPELEPFLPGPPPTLDSPEYAASVNEVKAIGGKNSTLRTSEQSQIAVFWSDFSYTAMPPGHWHEIAASIARARGNTLEENARLFALLSLAQADAAIVCWEAKYRFNLWRPITAIRRADEDGNPATEQDAAWADFLASPPFPSYTSGHSTFSKASAEVLAQFYGTDAITFNATSDSLPGVVRTFHSLADCADEVGMSRIYGGIHFQFDNRAGRECGERVGRFVAENFLLPNDRLPLLALESESAAPRVRVHGHTGNTCIIEASTDLRTWHRAGSTVAVAGGQVIDTPGWVSERGQFFRVREK